MTNFFLSKHLIACEVEYTRQGNKRSGTDASLICIERKANSAVAAVHIPFGPFVSCVLTHLVPRKRKGRRRRVDHGGKERMKVCPSIHSGGYFAFVPVIVVRICD